MKYKIRIDRLNEKNKKIFTELMESHKNCCSVCRQNIRMVFDTINKTSIQNLKYSLRRSYNEYKKFKKKECEDCGIDYNLHIHHIDENHMNNKEDNLKTLCGNCHTKVHKK